MKIIKVNYINGEARFVLEEFPKKTFCIKLTNQNTIKEVTDKLKTMIPQPDISEDLFDSLNLKSLEGSEL